MAGDLLKEMVDEIKLDRYYDPKTGLDSNGYSKEMYNHVQKLVKGPKTRPMSSEEVDKLLGI